MPAVKSKAELLEDTEVEWASNRCDSPCFRTSRGLTDSGYCHGLTFGGRKWNAHRLSYTLFKGEIPDGLHVDHLCGVRNCVNPDHLEAVSPRENNIRAKALVTHCPSGHEYSEENTAFARTAADGVTRICRVCKYDSERATRLRNPEKYKAIARNCQVRYSEKHADRLRAERLANYAAHAEERREYKRQWRANNAAYRANQSAYMKQKYQEQKLSQLAVTPLINQ